MKITLWDIKGFGRFNQFKKTPDNGFNIVYETNESGKSTLQSFIRAMLYGQKGGRKAKDGGLPPAKHFKPWVAEQYSGILEYTLENGSFYRIGRNFEKGTTNIHDGGANNLTLNFPQDKDVGPKFAEEHLGLDETTFERSVFIRQMQCAIDDDGRRILVEKLSNLNSTGSEDLSLTRALNALDSALLERVGSERSTTRPLDRINIRISELEQKKQAILTLNERYLDTVLSLHEKKSILKELNRTLADKEKQKATRQMATLHILKQELATLKEESDLIEQGIIACRHSIFELRDSDETQEDDISKAMLLLHDSEQARDAFELEESRLRDIQNRGEVLKEALDPEDLFQHRIHTVEEGIKNYTAAKDDARAKNTPTRGINQNAPLRPNWTKTIVLAGGFISLGLMGSFLANPSPVFLGLSILMAVFTGVIFFVSNQKKPIKGSQIQSDVQALNHAFSVAGFADMTDYIKYRESQLKGRGLLEHNAMQILECQNHLETFQRKADANAVQLMGLLGEVGKSNARKDWTVAVQALKQGVESLKAAREDEKVLLAKKKGLEDKYQLLLREAGNLAEKPVRSFDDLEKILLGKAEITGADKVISGNLGLINSGKFSDLASGDSATFQLSRELKEIEYRINEAQLDINTLNTRLEQAPKEGELACVIEELALFQGRKEMLEKVGSSLALASQVLSGVALKLQQDYIPALNEEMSRMVGYLTMGRYQQVRTNNSLQVNLEVPETDELIPVSRLSGGTIDQVYFSMRLAAVRLLEKGREPLPIFLDEPFAQYDEDRVKKAFELLKEISKERQIFFFTCREREFELAQAVFGENMNRIRL